MKKVKLMIGLVALSTVAFSQAKTDTLAKAVNTPAVSIDKSKSEYKPDPNAVYQIPLSLTATQVQLLIASPEDWKAIKGGKLTGEQITALEESARELRKSILGYLNALQQQDYIKWLNKSDTAKAAPVANVVNKKKRKKTLAGIKGKFLLSSYPSDVLLRYAKEYGWPMWSVEQNVTVNNKSGRLKRKVEVLTANYPLA